MSQISVAESRVVEELRERITASRRGRYRRAPLPRELWREATRCARQLGVYRASRALGVSYASLRVHLQGGESQPPGVSFVELGGSPAWGVGQGTALELERQGGVRLSIRLAPGEQLDVAALVAAFAGGQPCCK